MLPLRPPEQLLHTYRPLGFKQGIKLMIKPFSLAATIQRSVGSGYYVVPKPDHPLLLVGPDLLIGGEGKLTAVFFIRKTYKLRELKARIIACRLALPVRARVIALCDPDITVPENRLMQNFDEIISVHRSIAALVQYSTSDAEVIVDKKAMLEMKRIQTILFSTALQISTLRRQHESAIQTSDRVLNELRAKRDIPESGERNAKSARTLNINGSNVSTLPGGATMLRRLTQAWTSGMTERFSLDTGVPYADTNSQPSILLAEDWPTIKHDPEKPLRSSAFSGWILAQPTSSDDIALLIERAQFITRRRMYEWA
jgi:hypothetical protein